MKKSLFILFTFTYFLNFGQKNIQINYSFLENGEQGVYSLFTNNRYSEWQLISETLNSDFNLSSENQFFFFKNKDLKKLYFQTQILSKRVEVVDSLHPMKWEITNNFKSILGYNCIEAKTKFRGRDYTAYFSEDLPVNDGPWKFGGLPGLILEVKSDDDYIIYTATEISFSDYAEMSLKEIGKNDFITWPEYVETFKRIMQNLFLSIKTDEEISFGSEIKLDLQAKEIIYSEIQKKGGYTIQEN